MKKRIEWNFEMEFGRDEIFLFFWKNSISKVRIRVGLINYYHQATPIMIRLGSTIQSTSITIKLG